MSSAALVFSRRTSLFFGCEALADDGTPEDLTGVAVTCVAEHRESGEQRTLELVWVDRTQGRFEMWAPGNGVPDDWVFGTWDALVVMSRPNAGPAGRPLVLGSETISLLIKKAP
jgi:hypothetical protein